MIELKTNKTERAILVAIRPKDVPREVIQEHLAELQELAETAGAVTVLKIVQDRYRPDTATYIGKGKVEEIEALVEINEIDLIIFDDDLSPVQVRNLENMIKRKIIDRSGLILDIFASHARTRTARTQVELAQMQYMLPRLTRAWTHLSKQYGGIGTKGPGETQIETDRRIVRDRIALLKAKLAEIEEDRITQTKRRQDEMKVSLVGYTNAGKSTLFNQLTGAGVLAEDKLFATLDSTTRSFEIGKKKTILLSDTVGFIRKLPHHLVASFKSTLSEVREADVILHIIDMLHPFYEDHIRVVDETLRELGCEKKHIIRVFNKVDALNDKTRIEFLQNKFPDSVIISAERGINISVLLDKLIALTDSDTKERTISLPIEQAHMVHKFHEIADVQDEKYDEKRIQLKLRIKEENLGKFEVLLSKTKRKK